MRRIGLGFFLLSGLLLVLHGITPHRHANQQDASTICVTQKASEFYRLLNLVFQKDLGSNHLEDYSPEETGFQGKFLATYFHSFESEGFLILRHRIVNSYRLFIQDQPHPELSFRGPPQSV